MTVGNIQKTSRSSRKDDLSRVEHDMRRRVSDGLWPAGDLVPSRRELAAQFGVDLNTIQRAMAPLLSDGTLRAETGRGTYVADLDAAGAATNAVGQPGKRRVARIGITAFWDEDEAAVGDELPATMQIVAAIDNTARANRIESTFLNRWRRDADELGPADAARQLLADGVDSVLVVDAYTHPYIVSELRGAMDLAEQPVIYVSNVGVYVPCAHVFYDNRDAGFKAAERLIAAGFDEITFLTPYKGEWLDMRAEGARIACSTSKRQVKYNSTPENKRFDYYDDPTHEDVFAFLDRLIDSGAIRGGVIAPHDFLASVLMDKCAKRGLVAGRDFGLVGFDDEPRALARGLTTLRPPLEQMGAEAVRLSPHLVAAPSAGMVVSLRALLVERQTHYIREKNDGHAK